MYRRGGYDLMQQDSQTKPHGEYRKKPTGRIIENTSKILTGAEFIINRYESRMQLQLGLDEEVAVTPTNEDRGRRVTISNLATGKKVGAELPDISLLTDGNKPALTLFHLSLEKIAEDALGADGKLKQPSIRFKVGEYQELGGYSTAKAARRSIMQGARILQPMQVEGTLGYTNQWELTGLFRQFRIGGEEFIDGSGKKRRKRGDGWCTVLLETEVNWGAVIQCFTVLPSYYYSLGARPGALLDWVTYIARLRIWEIEQQGYFTLHLDTIQKRLGLPEAYATTQPGRDIRDAIYTAVKKIQEAHQEYFNNNDLMLEIIIARGIDDVDIEKFLKNGRLKVTIQGEMWERLKAAAGRKQLTSTLQVDTSKLPPQDAEI